MNFIKYCSVFLCLVLLSQPTYARWAHIDDVDVSVEKYKRNVVIHKDGTSVDTVELMIKPLKESGKDSLVSLPFIYNAANTEFKVIEAKTILNGKEYPVQAKQIEDKPLASSPQGFDQNNQVLIAFPQMTLDSTIYLKYQETVKEPSLPGFYSTDLIYGMGQHCQNSEVHIVSEVPLYIKSNDPEKYLNIKQEKSGNQFKLDVTLKRPIIKLPVDEQFASIEGTTFPWVTVSTLDKWSKLAEKLVEKYEVIVNQKQPELLEKITKEASTKSGTIDKINTVTSRLSESITYMGDWRTVKGAFVPRNLNEIVDSKFGDCKDFSATTTSILRKLGIKADMAIVHRGIDSQESPNDLPTMGAFNHAFVRVEEGKKILWIDPTNFTSFAQGIYPDIANRNALVMDPQNPHLARTTTITEKDSEVSVVKKISLPTSKESDADISEVTGQLSMSGILALPLIGADLKASKESINQNIISSVADESRTVDWKISDYDLKSRIAHNLQFKFNLIQKHMEMKTTAGKAFLLNSSQIVSKLLTKTSDRVSDLRLEMPGVYHYETLLPKASMIGKEFSTCSVDSPWFKGSRSIKDTSNGIQIIDDLIIKKDKVMNTDLKSEDYAQFQNKVHTCFGDTALVYKQ